MTQTLLLLLLGILCITTSCVQHQEHQEPELVTWQDITAVPVPAPDYTINYGPDSLQFGELRLPEGKGPFPVVVVVHGGCWLAEYDLYYMAHVGEALREAGYATWTPEFRRVGNQGGGWPGTFLDVAQAADYVRELAKTYPLDTTQVVSLGHSAGGHLALWLAARPNLPGTSELYTPHPLKLKGVVSLAGITDLAGYSTEEGSCNAAVEQLLGGLPAAEPTRYAQTSPLQLLPLGVPQRLIQGKLDPIVPVSQAQTYTTAAQAKGDDAQILLLPQAGHFDLVAPWSPVWPDIEQAVRSLFEDSE